MPLVQIYSADDLDQNILVIDGSANMRAASDGSTRFERAVSQARDFAEESIGRNVPVSIILAGEQASYIVTEESSLEMVEEGLSSAQCSFATGDIEGAMRLADALTEKSNAQVYYYTGTEYRNAGDINVIDVSSENDWNACVLDVRAESVDNYYTFYVDVAVYGSSKYLDISLAVNGMNDGEETVTAQSRTNCADGETVTVKFSDLGVYSFEDAEVSIRVDDGTVDSFENDDTFYLYGGTKETIRIQYASSLQNNFLQAHCWFYRAFMPIGGILNCLCLPIRKILRHRATIFISSNIPCRPYCRQTELCFWSIRAPFRVDWIYRSAET